MKVCYVERNFSRASLTIIEQANSIIAEFHAAGFVLTLRQLYYQFVGKALIPNTVQSYKRLGSIINDARMAGLIDWEAIEDRTRSLRARSHWNDPAGVIQSAADSYGIDLWRGQPVRAEVWIEKDALVGVAEGVCRDWDVPLFSCRGYASQSTVWEAAQRHRRYRGDGVVVIHLGDHDPSGIDMTRDIQDRLHTFQARTRVVRIALMRSQVDELNLPPNPAKETDSRFASYAAEHGDESWELDALNPKYIVHMIEEAIKGIVDHALFSARKDEQERGRRLLMAASSSWSSIAKRLEDEGSED